MSALGLNLISMYACFFIKNLADHSKLDSPFQLQEHLKALYYHLTKLDANDTTIPISHATAVNIATPPENVDRSLWLYELCRLLVQKANNLLVAFFSDSPACSAQTCPEMRASEWQYLCAVHDPPKSCCAIDYCCHTLDWAANVLTSQKHFPSRLTLGSDASGGSLQGVKQLTNIFRRVYRIFAHAWFQHRQVFWQVEGNEGLYIFFKTVCDMYNLIPEDNYTVPPEAEGITSEKEYRGFDEGQYSETMSSSSQGSIIRPPKEGQATTEDPATVTSTMKTGATFDKQKEDSTNATTTTISTGATTRRHKHTPSLGSAVTTIAEGDEDESTGARSSAEADESEDLLPKQVTRSSTVVFSRDEPTQDEAPEPSEHVIEPPEKITDLEVDVDNAGNTEQRKEPDTAGKQNALQEENQGTEPAGSVNEKDDMSKEEA